MALSFITDKERLERRGEERRGEVTRPVTKLKGERKTGLTRGAFHHRDYGDEVVNGVKKNERHPITRARSRRYQYPSNVTRHGGSRPIRDLLNSYPSSLDIWSFLKQKEGWKEGSKEGSARNRCIDGRKRWREKGRKLISKRWRTGGEIPGKKTVSNSISKLQTLSLRREFRKEAIKQRGSSLFLPSTSPLFFIFFI